MSAVLVLNQDHTPLTICSVQRAFLLVFLQKADLLCIIKNRRLRSVSKAYPFPSVIKINRYVNRPYHGVVLSRHNIFKRDRHKCQYCETAKDLTLDHVVPRSKGGISSWTNLVTACKECNAKKGDNTPEKAGMKLKAAPFRPSYVSFIGLANGVLRKEWEPYLGLKKASV